MGSSPRSDNVGVDAGLSGINRTTASALARTAASQWIPTFHNYELRIAASECKGPDGVFGYIRVDCEPAVLDVTHKFQPLLEQIAQRITELARGQGLRHQCAGPLA